MASDSVLDLEALLLPISEGAPTGSDLRSDHSPTSPYHEVKDARAAARAAERAAILDADADSAGRSEWRLVRQLAPRILQQHSKDLEITCWLIEALVRSDGFAGLRDGFRLARELIERYWDSLYPAPDEDGLATKVAPFNGLNGIDGEGTLIVPIGKVPITQGQMQGPFATWHYAQARELQRIDDEDRRQQRLSAGAVTMEMFQAAVAETPPEYFRDLLADAQAAADEFAALSAALDARCGAHDAPGSGRIRDALETVLDTLRFVARDVLPAEASDEPTGAAGATGDGAASAPSAAAPAGAADTAALQAELARSREEAFRTLARVAEYFRRAEPHSPVSYLLEQAVRWGRMPLPDLLGELIPEEGARETYNKLTGIRPAGE